MRVIEEHGRPLWVIGRPIDHTLSPLLHNTAFESAGLPHRYFALEVGEEELGTFLDVFGRTGGLGANLTLPLKQAVLTHVSRTSRSVSRVGAANTLYRADGKLALENTDVHGFEELVAPYSKRVRGGRVCLLGAGGAARACLYALGQMECPKVGLWNRTHEKALALREEFEDVPVTVLDDDELQRGRFDPDVVVNATSLGLDPDDPSPYPRSAVGEEVVGVDLIYGRETQFQRDFRDRGAGAVDGMTMLVAQAARAWQLWTGEEPDRRAMETAVQREL